MRPYRAATVASRRLDCALIKTPGVCFEHVQIARCRPAFYAISRRTLAMPRRCRDVACVCTARRSALWISLERRWNAVLCDSYITLSSISSCCIHFTFLKIKNNGKKLKNTMFLASLFVNVHAHDANL